MNSHRRSAAARSKAIARASSYFEALESRILLSSYKWRGAGVAGNWTDLDNWQDGPANTTPAAGDNVTFDGVHALTLTNMPTDVGAITIKGESFVTFSFDATHLSLKASGAISLVQTANKVVGMVVATNVPAQAVNFEAAGLDASGQLTGSNSVTVQAGTTLDLKSSDLNMANTIAVVKVQGSLKAKNALIMGTPLPSPDPVTGAVGTPRMSNVDIDGTLTLSGELRVGAIGKVTMLVDGGTVKADTFGVYNGSSLTIKNRTAGTEKGTFSFTNDSFVGAPLGNRTVAAAGLIN